MSLSSYGTGNRYDPMWGTVIIAAGHLLILFLALSGLQLLRHFTEGRFVRSSVRCPTQLAAQGQYEAPPRGWKVLYLIIQLIIPRLIFLTATIGSYLIPSLDFFKLVQQVWVGVEIACCPRDRSFHQPDCDCRKASQPPTSRTHGPRP